MHGSSGTTRGITALREAESADQADFLDRVNSSIPDEPVSARVIAIVPDNRKAVPVSFAGRVSVDNTPEDTQYEFLFEPGYEPDVLWRTKNNFEFPVYGPFKVQAVTALVSLDVNNLVYADGRADPKGAIPKGYYDVVFTVGSIQAREYVSLRLAATAPQTEPESEDVTPVIPDIPDVTPVSSVGSSGGGCDSGAGFAGLAALVFLKSIARKRR